MARPAYVRGNFIEAVQSLTRGGSLSLAMRFPAIAIDRLHSAQYQFSTTFFLLGGGTSQPAPLTPLSYPVPLHA